MYSYIQPYIGYQKVWATSKTAGVDNGDGKTPDQLQLELDLVNESAKNNFIFGVTILKRIVPGWFLRADLGLDIIGGGLSLEY
jgi:hypothetical protein